MSSGQPSGNQHKRFSQSPDYYQTQPNIVKQPQEWLIYSLEIIDVDADGSRDWSNTTYVSCTMLKLEKFGQISVQVNDIEIWKKVLLNLMQNFAFFSRFFLENTSMASYNDSASLILD